MEEILASIRRIIEDSDPGRKLPEESAELKQDLEPAPAEKPEAEVETFRAELRSAPEIRKPFTLADVQAKMAEEQPAVETTKTVSYNAASSPHQPMTLADVGAQVALGSREAADHATKAPVAFPQPVASLQGVDTIVADWRRDIATAGQSETVSPTVEARQEPHFESESDIEIFEDELTAGSSLEAISPRINAGSASVDEEPTGRPAIVSEHTGRQVAAAFGELSEAFAARSKKSFDDMAEEMLRPMLQDWLDNNLPTLVERLVREEIERVARGA
jgi:cell pole-organizing protein PopZ